VPVKMEQIECSETSAYIIKTPGNYPKENIMYCFKYITASYFQILAYSSCPSSNLIRHYIHVLSKERSTLKANSHIRGCASTVPRPCRVAPIHTCRAVPRPCSDRQCLVLRESPRGSWKNPNCLFIAHCLVQADPEH